MRHSVLLLTVLALLSPSVAQAADELTETLEQGPLVRVEVDKRQRFKRSTVLIDVAAPPELVWATLADFESYPSFMPRTEEVEITRKKDHVLVEMELDTPLVSTSYISRYELFPRTREAKVRVIDGDIEGSEFYWKLTPSPVGTRITYSGVVRNFSAVAESLDDDQQSITIGINVVSVLQAAKALKREAEKRHRARPKRAPAKR